MNVNPIFACFKPTNNGNNIINFQNTGGNDRGQIKGNGSSAVQYQTSSDRRLKTNIENMDSQLNNIMNLIPRKYNWIEDISEVGFGFIAQEVHNIYPEMRDNYDLTYCADNPNYHADCPCDDPGSSGAWTRRDQSGCRNLSTVWIQKRRGDPLRCRMQNTPPKTAGVCCT